jgi:hypothetical protein
MGRPIERRLLESDFKPTAYDRDRSKTEERIQNGGKNCKGCGSRPVTTHTFDGRVAKPQWLG